MQPHTTQPCAFSIFAGGLWASKKEKGSRCLGTQISLLAYAFLLTLANDSVSTTEDIKMYEVVIMECAVQGLVWGEMEKRGEILNKKINVY